MPTKKKFIKRNRPFVHEQLKSVEAQEQLGLSRQGIGSYFVSSVSARKGTGLSEEEIILLLPQILSLQPTDPDFRKEVDRFYTEINTFISYDRGREFEVGLSIDNDLPVTHFIEVTQGDKAVKVYNMPIELEDYVRFRHAQSHPWTAGSPEDAKGNTTIHFYVEDPELVVKNKLSSSDLADKAITVYQQVKDDELKVKAILTVLSPFIKKKRPGEVFVADNLPFGEQIIHLRELAISKPKSFYDAATDESLAEKYRIIELIRTGLLMRAGTSILVTESKELLGVGEEAAATALFKNPANAQTLQMLKHQYDSRRREEKALTLK